MRKSKKSTNVNVICLPLNDKQVKHLRIFAEDWSYWHLSPGVKLTEVEAVMVCLMHTAFGPKNINETGASGADPVEIDDPDLILAIRKIVNKRIKRK